MLFCNYLGICLVFYVLYYLEDKYRIIDNKYLYIWYGFFFKYIFLYIFKNDMYIIKVFMIKYWYFKCFSI